MSIYAGMSLRPLCRFYRRFYSAVSYRYPIPRDLVSGSAPRSDLESNADRRPLHLSWTVGLLIHLGDLDTAAEYARLAYSRRYCDWTAKTCDSIIGAMCEAKRYRDAFDLFHHFYNELKMGSTYDSPTRIVRALCDQGRVDDALVLFRARSHPCRSCYCYLTKGLVHAGRLDEALCLVRECPVPLACSYLIRGFLKLGNLDTANQLLEELELSSEEKHEAASLRVPFIEHWFEEGKDEEAMRCYQSLLCNDKFNLCGDTGKTLLKLLLRYGKKTEAWVLFHRMLDGFRRMLGGLVENLEIHVKVDSEAIDIMVGECFKEGRFKEGVETFYKVKSKVGHLKPEAYRNVITRCCEQGMLSEAECLLAALAAAYTPTAKFRTCRAMMDAYVKAGRVDDALQTANNMVDAHLSDLALCMKF